MVSVADTGTGIVSQEADRIFNPLFTTKSDGMGMGTVDLPRDHRGPRGPVVVCPEHSSGAVFQFTLQADIRRPPPVDSSLRTPGAGHRYFERPGHSHERGERSGPHSSS